MAELTKQLGNARAAVKKLSARACGCAKACGHAFWLETHTERDELPAQSGAPRRGCHVSVRAEPNKRSTFSSFGSPVRKDGGTCMRRHGKAASFLCLNALTPALASPLW